MTDNIDSNDPKKLADSDLAEVSGGAIPEEIRAYVDLLPQKSQAFIDGHFKDNDRQYLTALYYELRENGHSIEALRVDHYMRTGRLARH